jgi:hypothetical protein
MRVGTETTMIAYNGKSSKTAKTEALITGTVKKITDKYIWILNPEDGKIWKAVI